MIFMNKILATFYIEKDKWDDFKSKAKRNCSNASQVLIYMVNNYLSSDTTVKSDTDLLNERALQLELTNTKLCDRINRLERIIESGSKENVAGNVEKQAQREGKKTREVETKQGDDLAVLLADFTSCTAKLNKSLESIMMSVLSSNKNEIEDDIEDMNNYNEFDN